MTARPCPICHNGWEQDDDDVMRCRACKGSGILGEVIPKLAFAGPTQIRPESMTITVCGVSVEAKLTDTSSEIIERITEAINAATGPHEAGLTGDGGVITLTERNRFPK